MTNRLNKWGQTDSWESSCLKGRRNIPARELRLNYLNIKKEMRVLDLGCGDGLNLKILSERGFNKLFGVDISPKLIAIAKTKCPVAKISSANSEKLPFNNNYFDAVLVDSVFHHLMRYTPTLIEIKRVLKNGGKLCFIEPHKSVVRSLFDYISKFPFVQYIPRLKERSNAYLGEKKFMDHWIDTEKFFYQELVRLGYREQLKKINKFSIIGEYAVTK